MQRAVIESPFASPSRFRRYLHRRYAQACMRDALDHGFAPFASHLLYTQVLDDAKPEERERGIAAGLAFVRDADVTLVYTDLGISPGMVRGITEAHQQGRTVLWRTLGGTWAEIGLALVGDDIIMHSPRRSA